MIVASLLLVMLFIAALWMRRPGETAYGWFSAGLLFWCVSNAFYLVRQPGTGWYVLNHAATALYLCCMILFVHRLVGLRSPAIERTVFALTTATSLAALTAYTWEVWPLLSAGWVILQVLGLYQLVRLFVLCFTQRTIAIYWLASGSVLAVSFGVHDFLHLYGILDPAVPNLSQYGALIALLVFGSILVGRFADALRESEELNVSLDRKVQEKTAALEEQFDRTRVLEREMVLAHERERLVRDMHDGMGGQLISLLTLVRSGQRDPLVLEEAIAECIQDLRLMIDSMDTAGEDLAVGLGMLRARLEPRLRALGLDVHWDTHRLPEGIRLGPEGVLQVFRILQEALQNALKHADARALWIEAHIDGAPNAPAIVLTARDDGVGMPETPAAGRGLGNMRRRAEGLGATLTVEAAHPGTRVTLSLPR